VLVEPAALPPVLPVPLIALPPDASPEPDPAAMLLPVPAAMVVLSVVVVDVVSAAFLPQAATLSAAAVIIPTVTIRIVYPFTGSNRDENR